MTTYTTSSARPITKRRLRRRISRITRPDDGFDRSARRTRDQGVGVSDPLIRVAAATEGVVADLGALILLSKVTISMA